VVFFIADYRENKMSISALDDLFGDLGDYTDTAKKLAMTFVPTAAAGVGGVLAWRALSKNVILPLMSGNATLSKLPFSLISVLEGVVGLVAADQLAKHRMFGAYNDRVASGIAIGLMFDALFDLASTYLPTDVQTAVGLAGYPSRVALSGLGSDAYHLLNAAPIMYSESAMSGSPQTVENLGGAPVSVSEFYGAPISIENNQFASLT
jgi:hypothetical protein